MGEEATNMATAHKLQVMSLAGLQKTIELLLSFVPWKRDQAKAKVNEQV